MSILSLRRPRPAPYPASRGATAVLSAAALFAAVLAAGWLLAGCAPSGTDAAAGAKVFAQCASCHQVGPGARAGFGPQLNGLLGRRAGSTPDFAYSPAMKASGIVWDDRTLAAFVRNPEKAVPGTRMRFWGLGDDNQVKALLAYLHTFDGAPGEAAPAAAPAPAAPAPAPAPAPVPAAAR